MRLLFNFRSRKTVEPFVGVVQTCLARGHTVQIVLPSGEGKVSSLFELHAQLSFAFIGLQRGDEWRDSEPLLRSARDYLQYLKPAYRHARKLRHRAFGHLIERLGVDAKAVTDVSSERPLSLSEETIWRLERLAALCEDDMPPDALHARSIAQFRPDTVLISPLVHFGSAQADFAKAARSLGVPVGMLLFSWDNLSTKGALHVQPDRLFVWNERQKREAVDLHGMAVEDIRVTGAPRFDSFFALQPLVDRAQFCAAIGVDPARPVLLYLCSSKLVSEREAAFIRQWHTAIRQSDDERLRQATIVVRPHPDLPVSDKKWLGAAQTVRWEGLEEPVLLKRQMFGHEATVMLYSESARAATLHECIRHSHAVVGLNTSAEIEAGIVGRPVFTILADAESVDGQQSTLHFKYLLEEDGGFVRVGASLQQHEQQLRLAMAHPPDPAAIQQRVATFVRPVGWTRPAAEVMVDLFEQEFGGRGEFRTDQVRLKPDATTLATLDFAAPPGRVRSSGFRSASALDGPALERRLPRGDLVQFTRVSYAGADLYLATSSPAELVQADIERRAPSIVKWLEDAVGPADVVYVAPGEVGALALVAARVLGAMVYAFEGNIPRLARLWENVVLNGCESSLVPLPISISSARGLQKERCESASPASGREVPQRKEWRQHRDVSSVVVQPCAALTLDGAVKTWSLPLPQTLYIGPGLRATDAAAGGLRTLSRTRTCLVECQTGDVQAAVAALATAGLHLREQQDQPQTIALWFERR